MTSRSLVRGLAVALALACAGATGLAQDGEGPTGAPGPTDPPGGEGPGDPGAGGPGLGDEVPGTERPDVPGGTDLDPRAAPQPPRPVPGAGDRPGQVEDPGGTPRGGGRAPGERWPEAEGPPPQRDPAARGEEVRVERPEEVERIGKELRRIQGERPDFTTREAELAEQIRRLGEEDLSPQLGPREEVVRLSLEEAVSQALRNNPDFLVAFLRARGAAEGVPQAEAEFDPVLAFQGVRTEGGSPFFSLNPFSGFPVGLNIARFERWDFSTSLTKRFLLGTEVTVSWSEAYQRTENQFALNPSYTPTYRVDVVQPLLRGFGPAVNATNIRLAENDALANEAVYAQTLLDGALAVEQAYWDLVRAEEQLEAQESSLSSALKFLDDQRRRLEVGAAAELDVIIAKAGVATSREGVIISENALEAARDRLIRLVRPLHDPSKWDVFVVPTDRPWIVPEPDLSPERAVEIARQRRPDYYQAELAIDSARRTLRLRQNEALPAVDFVASFQEEGLGGQWGESYDTLGTGDFYTWTAGVRVSLPLFLRAERARVRQAELLVEESTASLEAVDASVILEIRTALRDITTAKARIEATRASRILAARRLDATRTQVEHGTAVPRDVLDDLAALARAEVQEVDALIAYRLAISSLRRAQGTLLDERLDTLDPGVRRALERRPYE